MLPYRVYCSQYETDDEKCAAEFIPLNKDGRLHCKQDRKGRIDWFIYRERLLNPLLFPFALAKMRQRPGVFIMELPINATPMTGLEHNWALPRLFGPQVFQT